MGRQEEQAVGYSQFACIGSGVSAIALGATLKRWYGITDVHFFERHSALGGTYANAPRHPARLLRQRALTLDAPGCACDVPSLLYSFSFAPNPKWTRVLASASELLAYLRDVADDYDLLSKMTFGAEVKRCEWIQQSQRWRIHVRNVDDDTMSVHECRFLFAGSGALVTPRDPGMPGLESFNGPVVQAARWQPDVKLQDKNVVLVGNGCTAAQIVPNIVSETKHLTQFVRSKHWIIPPIDFPTSSSLQWAFEHVPGLLAVARFAVYLYAENDMRGFYMTRAAARFRAQREASTARYVRKTAPAKYYDLLIPDFEIGCKRRIFDPGYLKALHAPNLDVTDDPITEVLPDAVRTKSGATTKADVIVLATGYSTNSFMAGIEVDGRNGVTMDEHWESFDGPEAYNCCAMNEFPNFFMLLGESLGSPADVDGRTC
ncbi:Baeyer-Villiger monooxygenase [Tolypocladium ophioglossoides CBS 100239]|uniref:Baeyer-Villiger monooxygenase n=1 Tax=Tolypocladium ophioglossoides (strain CBS 100239) TaxID=1163406 RepID=A0A0L0MWR8_TOLOC|nr:Baeyer-Villiger monooxygenase [Tolypocladium ophioglossoides CBS 100239]